jgi:hypothetical protein
MQTSKCMFKFYVVAPPIIVVRVTCVSTRSRLGLGVEAFSLIAFGVFALLRFFALLFAFLRQLCYVWCVLVCVHQTHARRREHNTRF